MQNQYQMHQEDNETKILVAQINGQAEAERLAIINHEEGLTKGEELALEHEKLAQTAKEFEAKMQQDKAKLELETQKHKDDVKLKEKQISVQAKKATSKK
jgi:hypothetical protein